MMALNLEFTEGFKFFNYVVFFMKKDQPWPGFDPLIHEPVRFIIMEALCQKPRFFYEFRDYAKDKDSLKITAGNLSSHLARLEDAHYIEAYRRYAGRTPVTSYKITETGRTSFEGYLEGAFYRLQESLAAINGLKVVRLSNDVQ
jgi:DNA-binding PadR family transcriptional regulator